jgi:hypothetical protein
MIVCTSSSRSFGVLIERPATHAGQSDEQSRCRAERWLATPLLTRQVEDQGCTRLPRKDSFFVLFDTLEDIHIARQGKLVDQAETSLKSGGFVKVIHRHASSKNERKTDYFA